jgi:hypothetical protein
MLSSPHFIGDASAAACSGLRYRRSFGPLEFVGAFEILAILAISSPKLLDDWEPDVACLVESSYARSCHHSLDLLCHLNYNLNVRNVETWGSRAGPGGSFPEAIP